MFDVIKFTGFSGKTERACLSRPEIYLSTRVTNLIDLVRPHSTY